MTNNEFDPTDPSSYKFWVTEKIRFADLDLMGHVNNTSFLIYAESARAAFMYETHFWVPKAQRQNVIVHLSIDYRRELLYPGEVKVGTRVRKIGNSSYDLAQALFNDKDECVATLRAVIVRMDVNTRKATPLNDEERANLEPYR